MKEKLTTKRLQHKRKKRTKSARKQRKRIKILVPNLVIMAATEHISFPVANLVFRFVPIRRYILSLFAEVISVETFTHSIRRE